MKTFSSDSVDLVVTDPPYGIGFMGKAWDRVLPPKEAFAECFRVLKPGALAFVMSSPRQDVLWRMMRMLEECGFELRQSFISWVYASGFPKAFDVSKGIDKKFHREQKVVGKYVSPRQLENGTMRDEWPTADYEQNKNKVAYGDFDGGEKHFAITEPASVLAKKWQGWKSQTGLKPALEVVLMVNKPFSEKTIVDQVLKSGTGAVNVDACRIPFQSTKDFDEALEAHRQPDIYFKQDGRSTVIPSGGSASTEKGRFPANLLVSDNALDDGTITKSKAGVRRNRSTLGVMTKDDTTTLGIGDVYSPIEDVGGFSRYFSLDAWAVHHGFLRVAKASKSERNEGLESLPAKSVRYEDGSWNSLEIFSNSYTEKSGNPSQRGKTPKHQNIHPTVKPVKLMAYLIELGCQKDGVVLDPFCGSGSTCLAARQLCRSYVGIDVNSEYVQIARKRLTILSQRIDQFLNESSSEEISVKGVDDRMVV